jgi:hypothetical protein
MNKFDIAWVVEVFAELGLHFASARHADSSVSLYQFRDARAYVNEAEIERFWAVCPPETADKHTAIAEFLETRKLDTRAKGITRATDRALPEGYASPKNRLAVRGRRSASRSSKSDMNSPRPRRH